MNRLGIACVAGILVIAAVAHSARAQAPKGRQGYVGGTVERSVSLGSSVKPSTGGVARPPRAPASNSSVVRSSPRTPSPVSTIAPRSKPVTSRQPGAVGTRGVASLLNDVSRAVANNAAATAPRNGGLLSRPAPTPFQRGQREASPLLERSERLFTRGRNRDDAGDDDSSGNDDDSQPTSAAIVESATPASVAPPPSSPSPPPTPAPQPSTPPGESLADQLARAYFRDALRFPSYNPMNVPVWRPDVSKTPPSLADPPAESLGDQLARENLRHMLNYLEAHQSNQKRFLKRIKEIDPGNSATLTPAQRQALLHSALDFYSRELNDLDALDEGTVGLSDSVKELKAKRRAALERALQKGNFLQKEPTKK